MRRNWARRFKCILICLMLLLPQMALGEYATLKTGDRSEDVLRMQQALNSLGYSLKVDGIFGKGTYAVVRDFQKDQELKVDGKAGSQTLTRLYELAGGNAPDASQPPAPAQGEQSTNTPAPAQGEQSTNTPAPAPTLTPPPGAELATVTGGSLRLRSARSATAAWRTRIPDKATVTVTQKGDTWCAVTYDRFSGFVMTKYLTFENTATAVPELTPAPTGSPTEASLATESPTEAPAMTDSPTVVPSTPTPAPDMTPPPGTEFATVAGGDLKLRSAPSQSAVRITSIPDKTRIVVTERGEKWSSVIYNGRKGHVMTEFLTFENTPAQATPEPTATPQVGTPVTGVTAKVIGGALQLSKQPDTKGENFISYVPDQTVLTVLEKGDTWSKVDFLHFQGYVLTEFLEFQSGSGAPMATTVPIDADEAFLSRAVPFATNCTAAVTGGNLDMYAECIGNNPIATIPDKAQVHVSRMGEFWCQVTYSGKSGYVRTQHLIFTQGGEAPERAAASSSTGKTVVREPQSFTIMVGSSCALTQTPGAQVRDFLGGDDTIAMPAQYKGYAYITGYKVGKTQFTMVEYDTEAETTYLTVAYLTVIKYDNTDFRIDYSRNTADERGWVQTNGYLFPVGRVHHVYVKILSGTDTKISFTSTNPSVASVDQDGTITAKAAGSTVIVVACGGASIPLDVTVYSATTGGGMNALVDAAPLKMYKSPSESAAVLTTIPFNYNLRLLEKGSVWCKTYYNGYTGYVKSDKLKFFCNSVIDASPVITPPPLK